jgi:hypothetical protein
MTILVFALGLFLRGVMEDRKVALTHIKSAEKQATFHISAAGAMCQTKPVIRINFIL